VTETLSVDCRSTGGGSECTVIVGDDPAATTHVVSVDAAVLERLDPGARDATALVTASFAFLLAREPREAILRTFDLPVIGRYFPGYEDEIGR